MLTIRDVFNACRRREVEGRRVIGAHIGEPSHEPPVPISEVFKELGEVGRRYLPFVGTERTRESISEFAKEFLGRDIDEKRIFVTNGGAQSLLISTIAASKLRKGRVLVPAPGFPQYFEHAIEFGYSVSTYDPLAEDLVNEVLSKSDDASAVLINYPNNPTGYTAPNSELRDLWDELGRRNVLLINDAAYSQIYFDERVEVVGDVIADTFSKTFALPGMRIGYVYWGVEKPELVGRLLYLMTAGVSEVSQTLITKMIEAASDSYFVSVRSHYAKLREEVIRGARETGLVFPEPRGAFYLYAKHPEVRDSNELALKLLGWDPVVGIVPAAVFRGGREFFRISYSFLKEHEIRELFKVMREAIES
ncbi:MAG: pyridoxal phosphate-dependent aminotransferase [Candidatus Korarchaeum sp.]|nr:pyridoxal phosphate-dependent aminotransferase [Candidatus Korarchaeum sp.]MDW8034910.1 pyridoxal phosphate-dependent aminotransferase [Candidatus Korarchaeum sp.]